MFNHKKGFTLIELLIVIGILAILLTATLIATNPQAQFARAKEIKLTSQIQALRKGLYQCMVDNFAKGTFSNCYTSSNITSTILLASGAGNGDLCPLVTNGYLPEIPVNEDVTGVIPSSGKVNCTTVTNYISGYTVNFGNGDPEKILISTSYIGINGAPITLSIGSSGLNSVAGIQYKKVAVGGTSASPDTYFACGLATNNLLYCWGSNQYGQLGNGGTSNSNKPVLVSGGPYIDVAAGYYQTCAIRSSDSKIQCWGRNNTGALGDNTLVDKNTPTTIDPTNLGGIETFTQVSIGDSITCGLRTDNNLYCWGYNAAGQVGDGTTTIRQIPTQVVIGSASSNKYSSVSTGVNHVCGILTNGSTACWGTGTSGQLGNGAASSTSVPVLVSTSGYTFNKIASGSNSTCAITNTGTVKCWGAPGAGRLGNNNTTTQQNTPVDATMPSGITSFSNLTSSRGGGGYFCALDSAGNAYCWGANSGGQLGVGDTADKYVPTAVLGGFSYTSIGISLRNSCGIRADGKMMCWGTNTTGNLGNGTTTNTTQPSLVLEP